MTPLQTKLAAMRAVIESATPGPWDTCDCGPWGGLGVGLVIGENVEHWGKFGERTEEPHISNAKFAAQARTDWEKCLAVIEELIEQRDQCLVALVVQEAITFEDQTGERYDGVALEFEERKAELDKEITTILCSDKPHKNGEEE